MDLVIAVISATITTPILGERRRFPATTGREPTATEMETLRRLVLTERPQTMHHIRRVEP